MNQIINFFSNYENLLIIFGVLLLLLLANVVFLVIQKRMLLFWNRFKFLQYFWAILTPLVFTAAILMFSLTPTVVFPNEPSLGVSAVSKENPVVVKFDRPINKSMISYEITPAIKGRWKVNQSYLNGQSSLVFTPSESPDLETRYTILLKNIKNSFGSSQNYMFSFQSPGKPKVLSVTPGDGDQGVLPSQEIAVNVDNYFEGKTDFEFETTPAVVLDVKRDKNKFLIKPQAGWAKGTEYHLKVKLSIQKSTLLVDEADAAEKEILWEGKFKTIEASGVKTYSPTGTGIYPSAEIKIEFKQDMDKGSVERIFQITPRVDGKFSWESERIVSFKPNTDLNKNTQYTVSVSKEAKISSGEALEELLEFNFTTLGHVNVGNIIPSNNAKNISTSSAIKITFNQPVDHSSAEAKFSLSPNIAGTFSWSDNTMSFAPQGLENSQRYEIKVASGVRSIYGLDSNRDFSSSFETSAQSVMLSVPSYHQAHMYSCMASAARSALAFKGANYSEDAILSRIGYDRTSWSGTWNEAGSTWGDPNQGIVGDVDGKANNIGWGYGAHWSPVASAIQGLGKTAEVKSGWDVSGIAQELVNGNPVIIWWVNGVWPAYEVTWYKNGSKIRAVNSMHVQVVKGFTGTVQNPLTFTVTDSGYGYPAKTFDAGTFKAKWSWFGNTAIVVK